jgi:hypothetical protein
VPGKLAVHSLCTCEGDKMAVSLSEGKLRRGVRR